MIPKNLIIGFRERESTYNNRVGFISYMKGKGDKRKIYHSGFTNYVDASIPVLECENSPLEGFYFNGVAGGQNCVSGRKEKLRVMDPRGFEFELGIRGVEHVLTHATISPGKGIEGKFVYGWFGLEGLMLISVNSEQYKNTKEQISEIPPDELIFGHTYETLAGTKLIYLGLYGDLGHGHDMATDTFKITDYTNVSMKRYFAEIKRKDSKNGYIYRFTIKENRKVFKHSGLILKHLDEFKREYTLKTKKIRLLTDNESLVKSHKLEGKCTEKITFTKMGVGGFNVSKNFSMSKPKYGSKPNQSINKLNEIESYLRTQTLKDFNNHFEKALYRVSSNFNGDSYTFLFTFNNRYYRIMLGKLSVSIHKEGFNGVLKSDDCFVRYLTEYKITENEITRKSIPLDSSVFRNIINSEVELYTRLHIKFNGVTKLISDILM